MSKTRKTRNRNAAARRRERLKKLEQQKSRRRRKRNKQLRLLVGGLAAVLLLYVGIRFFSDRDSAAEAERVETYEDARETEAAEAEIFDPIAEAEAPETGEDPLSGFDPEEEDAGGGRWTFNENLAHRRIQSEVALLYNLDEGEIVYEKNADLVTYPASLTKMMTQIVAIENLTEEQLDAPVSISEETYQSMIELDAALSGFVPGERITVRDLMYANFLASGGDASETIALTLFGSEAAFVERMNEKAAQLGMENTVFKNPTGLHEEGHVTTAEDLLTLALYAFENDDFIKYFTAQAYETQPLDEETEGHVLTARLWQMLQERNVPYRVHGGKTGFTEEAGLCLTSVMERSGTRFLIITMGAPYEVSTGTDLDDHLWLMRGLSKVQ